VGLVLVGTVGLCIWIVLWATESFSGFDSILVGIVMVLLTIAVRGVLPYLPGRRS
jgi:hypothetical protein